MGELRSQVDQALTGAKYLDPNAPDRDELHYESDTKVAMKDAIGGLITAVRLLADHLDAQ
jgi:hypothetical protein